MNKDIERETMLKQNHFKPIYCISRYVGILIVLLGQLTSYAQKFDTLEPDLTFAQIGLKELVFVEKRQAVLKIVELSDHSYFVLTVVKTELVSSETRVYKITHDGKVDKSMNNGKGYYSYDYLSENYPMDVVKLRDGKVLMVLRANNGSSNTFPVLIKLQPSGVPDPSYADNGVLEVHLERQTRLHSFSFAEDSSLYLGGTYKYDDTFGYFRSIVLKLTPDGNIDKTFQDKGIYHGIIPPHTVGGITTPECNEEYIVRILAEGNKYFYLLGNSEAGVSQNEQRTMIIIRFVLINGQIRRDSTYGTRGKVTFVQGNGRGSDYAYKAEINKDGGLLVQCQYLKDNENVGAIVSLDRNGNFNKTFGKNGVWDKNSTIANFGISGMKYDSLGRIWIVGGISSLDGSGVKKAVVARLTSDGKEDITFGKSGYYILQNTPYAGLTDFHVTSQTIMVSGVMDEVGSDINRTYLARYYYSDLGGMKHPKLSPTLLAGGKYQCQVVGYKLPFESSSPGKITLDVQAGPCRLANDSLYIKGEGVVELRFRQEQSGLFFGLDTTVLLPTECKLLVNEYITPNNDGFNDKFVINNIEFFQTHSVTVVNKRQEVVYSSHDYKNNWEPTHLQTGTYYYIVRAHEENKTLKGVLLLEKE